AGGAQRDACRRVVAACPHVARGRLLQLRKDGRALQRLVAEGLPVVVVERSLEGSGEHVAVEQARVRVIEDGRLDASAEQRLRLAHEVLVERVLAGDEDGQAVSPSAGTAPLLAQAGYRAGEADGDDRVEKPDVDAELERVRRGHAEQLALDEPPLD